MTNRLRFDTNGQVENPTLVLGTVDGRKLGYLNAGTSFVYQQNFNSANEISFTVYKDQCGTTFQTPDKMSNVKDYIPFYCLWASHSEEPPDDEDLTDALCGVAITGETICGLVGDLWTIVEPEETSGFFKWVKYYVEYWDGTTGWIGPYCLRYANIWENITDLLTVWYKEIDEWFQISVQVDDSDTTCKQITGTSICESELSQTNIFTTEINTEDDILRDDYTEPTVFYNPDNPDASLLNRMMDKIPQYKIAYVDNSLRNIQRTFSFDKITILDAFNEVAEEIGCLFLYDSSTDDDNHIARTVNAYDLQRYCKDCGYRFEEDGDCPRCGSSNIQEPYGDDSGIIISRDNLSDEAIYKTDIDSVKNCFKLSAGDDLMTATIRSCNANGSDYLWMFPSYLRKYMTDELVAKLEEYEALYTEYENAHNFTINSTDYNNLVTKYRDRNEDLTYIYSGTASSVNTPCVKLTNFPQVISAWYYVIDFEGYLKTTMMPTVDISSTNAEAQAEDIYNQLNGKSVSVTDLKDYTSAELIATCVKSLAKLYAYTSKYTVTVTTNTWNNPTWTGTVTITNNNDEDDTATTSLITMTATAGIEAYAEQLIQVKLNKANTDDYSVTDLFNSYDDDRDEFIRRLTLYSYDCLVSFSDCCQTCIGILDEQYEAFSTETYQTLIDFRNEWIDRGALINEEMSVRDSEIIKLVGNGATEPDKVVYGIYDDIQEIVDKVHSILDVENFLGEDLWYELLNYRREDTYNNTNYISDGLSNAELIENAELFLDAASKELYKSAMLQHSITSTLKNLLVMPEFERIVDNFQVGSWIRFIVDGTPYKLRLLSYEIQFDNTQNIDVEFSDVKDIWNGASDIESILKSAVGMGSSYSSVTRQAEKGSDAEGVVSGWTQQGLPATLELVSNADNQEMIFDEHGLLLRRYNDITETYLNDQIKLINSTIAFTDDAWDTIHTAIGRIYAPNGEQVFGINTKYLIGQFLIGEELYIESVSDTGETVFKVDADGVYINMSKSMTEDGNSLYGYINATAKGVEETFYDALGNYYNKTETAELVSTTMTDALGNYYDKTETASLVETTMTDALGNYSTTTQTATMIDNAVAGFVDGDYVKSEIQQFADSISMTVSSENNGMASIQMKVGDIDTSADVVTEAREAFAASETSIEIGAGTIEFLAGTLIIDSNYFKVDATGNITATSGTIGGWTIKDSVLSSENSTGTAVIRLYGGSDSRAIQAGSYSNPYVSFSVNKSGDVTLQSMNVMKASDGVTYGSIGYMEGSTGTETTYGIGIINNLGDYDNYFIITDSGVRMQAKDTAFSVVDGGATLASGNLYLGNAKQIYFTTNASDDSRNVSTLGMDNSNNIFAGNADYPMYVRGSTLYLQGELYSSSDKTLKHDIEPLSDSYLQVLDKMEPKEFKYNSDASDLYQFGYIAQDVAQAVEDSGLSSDNIGLVKTGKLEDGEDEVMFLNYNSIIAMLHLKIKQLEDRINKLEEEKE